MSYRNYSAGQNPWRQCSGCNCWELLPDLTIDGLCDSCSLEGDSEYDDWLFEQEMEGR